MFALRISVNKIAEAFANFKMWFSVFWGETTVDTYLLHGAESFLRS